MTMTKLGDAEKISNEIGEKINQLLRTIGDLEKENGELRAQVEELKNSSGSAEVNDFGINATDEPVTQPGKKADDSIPSPDEKDAPTMTKRTKRKTPPRQEGTAVKEEPQPVAASPAKVEKTPEADPVPDTSEESAERPTMGPDSINEMDLDELLANDALVNTVYHRLLPLKQLKYRLLAMQMGISIDRCKTALEKLEKVGAVTINEKEIVKIVE